MINYKQVVDKLQSLIPDDYEGRFWNIELSQHYSGEDDIVLIYLQDCGNGNKYRLYHSELNDEVNNDRELFEGCLESLKEVYGATKCIMGSMIDSGYIVLGEIDTNNNILDKNFNIGDTVRIRNWSDMENEFGLNEYGEINCESPNFILEMAYLCGKEYTIEKIGLGSDITLSSSDTCKWGITTDMIEKVK